MLKLVGLLFGLSLIVPFVGHADSVKCYCVKALREIHAVNIRGDAVTQKPNIPTSAAKEGDVLLMRYPKDSHVALITKVKEVGTKKVVTIEEYNFRHCKQSIRTISLTDKHVLGVLRTEGVKKVKSGSMA